MFRTKDFLSIVAGAVNRMRAGTQKITDYRIGSVARTLIEGPAVEIDELYQNMLRGLVDAIPVALFKAFSFDLLPAAAALGVVRFSLDAATTTDTVIPAGQTVATEDQQITYTTLAGAVIPAGQTQVSASVACTQAGSAGNVSAGRVTVLQGGPSGVAVTNLAPISNGRDDETPPQREARFKDFIANLSRGPLATIEYGAQTAVRRNTDGVIIERAIAARAIERYMLNAMEPLGYVNLYIYNGADGASSELISEVQRVIDGYRETDGSAVIGWKGAGVIVNVNAVSVQTIDLAVRVRTSDSVLTDGQKDAMTAQIDAYIASVGIGGPAYYSGLNQVIRKVPGIVAVYVTPDGDIGTGRTTKIVLGTVSYELLV